MAEILVMNKTNGTDAGHYRIGDIVFIGEDGHSWGTGELNTADFIIVKVPGVPRAKLESLREDGTVMRRKWQFLKANLSVALRNVVNTKGGCTIGVDLTRAQAEAVIINKETLATANLNP